MYRCVVREGTLQRAKSESVDLNSVCVFMCVCFNGLHKFAVYETNVGGFVRLLEFSFLKSKINVHSLRNASQLYVSPFVCQYISTRFTASSKSRVINHARRKHKRTRW